MKLIIDVEKCAGHGRCYTVAPELLSYDDEGFVAERGEWVNVPVSLEEAARNAMAVCPERAITAER